MTVVKRFGRDSGNQLPHLLAKIPVFCYNGQYYEQYIFY